MALADLANRYVDDRLRGWWRSRKVAMPICRRFLNGHQPVPRADDLPETGTAELTERAEAFLNTELTWDGIQHRCWAIK